MSAFRIVLVLLGAWVACPPGAPAACALPIAVALVALAFEDALSARRLVGVGAACGVGMLALAVVDPALWFPPAFALAIVAVFGLATASGPPLRRALAVAVSVGLVVPLVLFVVVARADLSDPASALRAALPPDPVARLVVAAARTVAVVAMLRAFSARIALPLAAFVTAVTLARLAYVLGVARLDSELFWPEAPMLVNALKLASGEVLYGPRAELSSYSYAPLLDVLHHALLAPLGRELDLHAHRVLVLLEQAVAGIVLVLALRPRLRPLGTAAAWAAAALVVLACFANLLAPAVHPDHALLVCFALAMAVLLAGDRLPRTLRDVLLVGVTPVAVGFKLSGGGLGVALVAVALGRKRWRDLALLAVSAVLSVATVPLFDRWFGAYSFYAVTLQRSHPIRVANLASAEWQPFGAALVVAVIAVVALRLRVRERARPVEDALVLTAIMALASLPAAVKYAGRENNAAVVLVGCVVVLVLVAASVERLGCALLATTTLMVVAAAPVRAPPDAATRAEVAADTERMTAVVREDARAGERTLLLTSVLPWIRAGRRDVPHDRWQSAIELWIGHYPEGELLPAHLRAGAYRHVVASGSELHMMPGPAAGFQEAAAAALAARYDEISTPRARARVYERRAP